MVVFGLMEMRLEDGRLFEIMKWRFKDWKEVHNFHLHDVGRMVLFGIRSVHLEVLGVTAQVIH